MAINGVKKIDYVNTLKKFGKSHFSGLKIDDDGADLLSNSLNDVNNQLVHNLEEAYNSEPKIYETIFYQCAQKAIKNVFIGRTIEHALSEAYKQLALLESGCMTYEDDSPPYTFTTKTDPRSSNLPKKPSTEKEVTDQAQIRKTQLSISLFKSGVMKFASMSLPSFSLNKIAGHLLGFRIYNFAKIVTEACAKSYHKKEELQPVDIRNVINTYLGKSALKAANGEGCKWLLLYENGLVDFKARREIKSGWSKDTIVRDNIYASVFLPSIRTHLKENNPDSNIDSKAPKFLGHTLMDVALYLAKNTSEICEKKKAIEMGSEEVNRSISSVLPEQLRQHALLKASEDVRLYQRGLLVYNREMDKPKIPKAKTYPNRKSQKEKTKFSVKSKKPQAQKKRKRTVSTHKKKDDKRLKIGTDKPKKISALYSKRKSKKIKKKIPVKSKKPQAQKKRKRTVSTHKKKDDKSRKLETDKSETISPLLEKKSKESDSNSKSNPPNVTPPNTYTLPVKTQQKTSQQNETKKHKTHLKDVEPSEDIPTPTRLKFGPAITDILPVVFESAHVSLTRDSKSKVCKILEDACDALVKVSIAAADSAELDFKEIKASVQQQFPVLLGALAVAHGSNVVQSWEQGTKVPLD